MKKRNEMILGGLIILVGIFFGLRAFGVISSDISLDGWWTLFIILPCLNGLIKGGDVFGNLMGLAVGILLLLDAREVLAEDMTWKLLLPVLAILFGVKLVLGAAKSKEQDGEKPQREETVSRVAAIFSGATCNLRDASLKDGAYVDVLCIFGGADILVPKDVRIEMHAFCIFGGIADKRKDTVADETAKTLHISGFCLFGGADIK